MMGERAASTAHRDGVLLQYLAAVGAGLIAYVLFVQPAAACTLPERFSGYFPAVGSELPLNAHVYAAPVWGSVSVQASRDSGTWDLSFDSVGNDDAFHGSGAAIIELGAGLEPGPVLLSIVDDDGPIMQANFRLSSEPDVAPPDDFEVQVLSVSEGIGSPGTQLNETSTCYFPPTVILEVTNPGDDWGVVGFHVIDENGSSLASSIPWETATTRLSVPNAQNSSCFTVVATDLGGNQTASERVCIEQGCDCSAAHRPGASTSPALWSLLALVGFIGRRRHRAARNKARAGSSGSLRSWPNRMPS